MGTYTSNLFPHSTNSFFLFLTKGVHIRDNDCLMLLKYEYDLELIFQGQIFLNSILLLVTRTHFSVLIADVNN